MYFYVSDNLKDTIIYTINQLIVNILIHYFHKFKQFLNEYKFSIYFELNRKLNGKYHDIIVSMSEDYIRSLFHNPPSKYPNDVYLRREGHWSIVYSVYLLQKDREKGKERIKQLLNESLFLLADYFRFLEKDFGEESVPWLVEQLFKDSGQREHFTVLFGLISKYDIRLHIDRILEFMINHSNTKSRNQAAVLLAKYPEEIFPIAEKLVNEKTVDQRIAGAQILAELNTEEATELLNKAVDQETNDDTRNIMLESLAEKRFAIPYTFPMVKDMIDKAEGRKKLTRWNEKWIEEDKLPKLFWLDNKAELKPTEIRFLIYRMKQAKGLNSDIEARQMIHCIDKSSSSAFAKAMLVAFQNSNADSKLKYYLSIAGLLGGDEMTYLLNSLFRKSIADKRVKMAEYAIGALAMVGTSKALRSIEVIYRKFANKKPAISAVAKEALTTAATELNISMDELADRIIPDFDFDGLYKHFEVDGDEYRAFVNADFGLSFINESNKIRKSVPPNTSKELKAEFKEIETEIRDVVKSQSGRLEKYMLDERRWAAEDWHNFFFMNPILFVYAMKLVWGVFDENNNLEQVFYCTEDASLYDVNDDEVAVPADRFVGILHPALLSIADRKLWFDKIFDMQLSTIFPIFERTVFSVADDELELNYTKHFFNQDVPKGADFVNTFLVKRNWLKTSGDGARSNFTKHFRDGKIIADANIDGPMAFYSGGNTKATVFEISFITVKEMRREKVLLKDVPPVFYSEVMFDIDQLLKAE